MLMFVSVETEFLKSVFLIKNSLGSAQHAELQFQRYQAGFIHTLDLGRQLFAMADQETQEQLQADLGTLQEDWDKLQNLLGRRTELTQTIIKVMAHLLEFRLWGHGPGVGSGPGPSLAPGTGPGSSPI